MTKRPVLIAVAIGAILLGVILFTRIIVGTIRVEADKTRTAMSEAAAQALPESIDRAMDLVKGDGQEVAGQVGGAAARVLDDIHDILRGIPTPPKPTGGDEKSQSTKPTPTKDKPTDASLDPSGIIGELFKTGREVTRALDKTLQELVGLDEADEREIGKQVHAMICAEQPVVVNPALNQKLRELAAPFLSATKRKTIDYTFTVLNDPEINAFAHLGGYVYVNRGLLELIDDDAQLQFVVGHEIAHVDLKHCVEQMTFQARAGQVAGEVGASIVQLGYDAVARGYSEDRELEADAWSYSQMGASRPSAIAFLNKLAKVESNAGQPTKPDGVLATTIHEVENHFRTHPASSTRIEALKKIH